MITLRQFIELQLVANASGMDSIDKQLLSLSIFTGKNIADLEKLSQADFSVLYKKMTNAEIPNFEPLQAAGKYRMPKDAGEYPLRQWIAIENGVLKNKELIADINAADFSGVPDVLAVACLPANVSVSDFAANKSREFDDYNTDTAIQGRAVEFLGMPAHEAMGLFAFFLSVLRQRKTILSPFLSRVRAVYLRLGNAITKRMGGQRS